MNSNRGTIFGFILRLIGAKLFEVCFISTRPPTCLFLPFIRVLQEWTAKDWYSLALINKECHNEIKNFSKTYVTFARDSSRFLPRDPRWNGIFLSISERMSEVNIGITFFNFRGCFSPATLKLFLRRFPWILDRCVCRSLARSHPMSCRYSERLIAGKTLFFWEVCPATILFCTV